MNRLFEPPTWGENQDSLADLVTTLTNNFSAIRTILQNTGNVNQDIHRRIQQADQEFTRLQAQSLRQSMERRQFNQQQERMFRPRRDSDSSTDSDNSDIDLDFYFPTDLMGVWGTPPRTNATTDTTSALGPTVSDSSIQQSSSSAPNSSAVEEMPTTSSEPTVSSNPFKVPRARKAKKAVKRKAEGNAPNPLPTKRTMATSTDDFFLETE